MAPPDAPATPTTAKKTNMPTLPDQIPEPEMFDEVFLIQVGKAPNTHTFPVHKGVARFYSGYFTAALRDDTFKEGNENIVVLENEDVDRFRILVAWLYTRHVKDIPGTTESMPLIELWIMSDRYDIPSFGNYILGAMDRKSVRTHTIPVACIDHIYENTPGPCGIRTWLVDKIVIGRASEQLMDAILKSISLEFFRDFARASMKYTEYIDKTKGRKKDSANLDMCDYHIHNEGEKCSKK